MKTLKDSLQASARNTAWCNWVLYKACLQLTHEEFIAPRTSFFPSLQLTLNHILLVDLFYFDALKGGSIGHGFFKKSIAFENAPTLWNEQKKLDSELVKFCDQLHDEDMEKEVRIHRGPKIAIETVASTLHHMFLHETHHRGQVHSMLSGTGIKPPQLDEFFLRNDAQDRLKDLSELQIEWPDDHNPLT